MAKKDLDWGNLGFNYMPCDYSYVCNYKDGAWEEGGLTEDHTLTLSEDAGIFLYEDKVKQINDTRLRYTTQELDNKHEIALTVPTIESWNENDEIHFGDADNGRAIAWIRFGETMASQKVSEEEIQRRIDNMPKAEEWEKVDGSNFANKHADSETSCHENEGSAY